ncbi:MAG TPA: OmpA family protein [Chitinophaga sp.]|uniref:OmpA family protein n=1 Tax=Chitinophaga sp. TaxID=1869181 RepID=UPI002B5A7626|nr:OmpA family protein [Chitinophaga sp.]HVI46423.1 OmpA family protein [Chitinophaga sp.]
MKKLIILTMACSLGSMAHAQFLDRLKNKVQQKVNDAVDKTIDKTVDKASEGKKKPATPTTGENAPVSVNTGSGTEVTNGKVSTNTNITSYSLFDFVPGEKIVMHEDFKQDAVGDFPAQWNTRTGGEVVTVNNQSGKWLRLGQDGVFYPEYINTKFPDNFTLQMDVMANNEVSNIGELAICLLDATNVDDKFERGTYHSLSTPSFKLRLNPVSSGYGSLYYSTNLIGEHNINAMPAFNVPAKNSVKVSIWRQKQRVRVYLDSTKVLDLPRALDAAAPLNALVFSTYSPDLDHKGGAFFVGNIRMAVGAPDTRNKLITEGKFVTHGILFDTNSDKIKAESYGALKDIAGVLTENAGVRVKIVGHTDTDGNDQANLDLSKRRAEAVKTALSTTFGIDASRLETDGKGKTQPVDSNNTEIGKANNRRVEFIKL